MSFMRHYYVLTSNPAFLDVFTFIQAQNLKFEVHLNRIRFWTPEGPGLTELLLRFSENIFQVDDAVDLATGLRPL